MPTAKKYTLSDYRNTNTLSDKTIGEGLLFLANMINYASEQKNVSIAAHAIKLAEELERRKDITSAKRALLYSYLINAWNVNNKDALAWENKALGKEIFYGRKALLEKDFNKLPLGTRLSIYTNLGNALFQTRRILDAIEYYNLALSYKPDFGMALGAKARAISSYAYFIRNTEAGIALYSYAEELYLKAVASHSTQKHALPAFKNNLNKITQFLNKLGRPKETNAYNFLPLRKGKANAYHLWCLQNDLILNPVNLIPGYKNIKDTVHTPSMFTDTGKIPPFYAYFNQLKQEFLAARFLCFEGTEHLYQKHYSDRYGYLLQTYDHALWDYHTQQVKLAFLTAYAVLDKVAMYIDSYFNLHQPKEKINFRSVWYQHCDMTYNKKKRPILREEFVRHSNGALLSLHWLSKDFRYSNNAFYALEPEADKLKDIRNNLEHHFFQIRMIDDKSSGIEGIDEQSLRSKTIKLLKLVHYALTYLAFAVTIEEEKKDKQDTPSDKVAVPMIIDKWTL